MGNKSDNMALKETSILVLSSLGRTPGWGDDGKTPIMAVDQYLDGEQSILLP